MSNLDQKRKKRLKERKTTKGERERKREEESVTSAFLGEEEMGPRSEEIQGSGLNSEYRHISLENVMGGNDWGGGTWGTERSSITDA